MSQRNSHCYLVTPRLGPHIFAIKFQTWVRYSFLCTANHREERCHVTCHSSLWLVVHMKENRPMIETLLPLQPGGDVTLCGEYNTLDASIGEISAWHYPKTVKTQPTKISKGYLWHSTTQIDFRCINFSGNDCTPELFSRIQYHTI